MKRFTTILCCVCLMIAGAGLALSRLQSLPQNTIAAAVPYDRPVGVIVGDTLPTDIQLDLDKLISKRATSAKDSVNIIDSVRWVTKTRWKTRYRDAAHITHDGTGNALAATTPDGLPSKPANNDMLGREEQPKDSVATSKVASIQLIVDDKVVYSTNDNHSADGSQ